MATGLLQCPHPRLHNIRAAATPPAARAAATAPPAAALGSRRVPSLHRVIETYRRETVVNAAIIIIIFIFNMELDRAC